MQKAINGLYTTFCLLPSTAMSLSRLPSGVIVTYTIFSGTKLQPLFKPHLNVGSLWQSSMKFMPKLFITHGHQHIELNYPCTVHRHGLPANLRTPPRRASKQLDTTGKYQHTSRHHQQILAKTMRKYPKSSKRHQILP